MTDSSHYPRFSDTRSRRNHAAPRMLVIGLDGATYDVLTPLAYAGVMPNLASLMRRSALAELNSTLPFTTPVAWTSFQTGADAQTHGVLDYRYLDHERRQVMLNHAGRIACPTLFEQVSAIGDVVALNLPMTFPPSPRTRGLIVGGLDSPSAEAALGRCPKLLDRLQAEGVHYHINTIWKRKPETFDELAHGVARTIDTYRSRARAAEIADELVDWRLMVVQFQTLDSFQHRCWHLLAEGAETADAASIAEARRAMRALDDAIGRLLEMASAKGAAVAVLGDHGFGPFREKICVNEVLRRRGLLKSASWSNQRRYRVARSLWKMRRYLGRRFAGTRSAILRRPLSALAPIDWRQTRAFAVHGELAGLVYLNDRERFEDGALAATRQREQAEADALAAFREAVHPRTGEPLFEEVYAVREAFGIDPIERRWPDIVAIPADGFQTRAKFSRGERLLVDDPTLTGTHRRVSALMVEGPASGTGGGHTAEMRDVAPTILHLLGLPPLPHMTGRVLTEMLAISPTESMLRAGRIGRHLRAAHAHSHPHAMVPKGYPTDTIVSHREQAVVEQRLRELGYLE